MITDPLRLPSRSRALLLFSGGFDSTLVALLLRQQGIPTVALTVNYNTRPKPERQSAERTLATLAFERHLSLDLPMADFRNEPELWPDQRHEGWFPYRNVIFFGIAAHFAVRHRCNVVAAGIRVWDESFDDATQLFLGELEAILQHSGSDSTSNRLNLFLPLLATHDLAYQAVLAGGRTEEILRSTWSCWRNGSAPCGLCAPCRDRERFFAEVERRRAD